MKKNKKSKKRNRKKKEKITARNPCVADGSLFNKKGGLLDQDKKEFRNKKRRKEDTRAIEDGQQS